jgi:hypothetical protein
MIVQRFQYALHSEVCQYLYVHNRCSQNSYNKQVQWFTWWSPPVLVLRTVDILSQGILLPEMSFLAWMTFVRLTNYREIDLSYLRAQEYTDLVCGVCVLCVHFVADISCLAATDN